MHIIHLSAECYPAAKAGGLGDVVGSLPKYLNQHGEFCEVIIPKYRTPWLDEQEFDVVWESSAPLGQDYFGFTILKEKTNKLGFPFYVIDIPGRFDRPGVYIDPWSGHGYWDEFERALSFQIAALEWIRTFHKKPDVIHCHDHHTGLVPFMIKQCVRFSELQDMPSIITVHNAEYQGQQSMMNAEMLPPFIPHNYGLLEWNGQLNSLASALKCAWQITTVSQSYMQELGESSSGLEPLFNQETAKSRGIINGIDTEVWDPSTDPLLEHNYTIRGIKTGKKKNKAVLCEQFGLNPELPTIAFIGRLVREKGADLLPDLISHFMHSDKEVNFILLGTGDPSLHDIFARMENDHFGYFDATLEYNEKLAHQMYAGSDFILMPSRVEPCGLNQMFAMRYGTIPIVRSIGGLIDTVKDLSDGDGYGIRFDDFTLHEAEEAINRAIDLFADKKEIQRVVSRIAKLDYSWNNSAKEYINMYKELINLK
ncbi:MAG: glycogen synthase [Balneolaceae bacterium]|nr:glycogen synthase [Balneolaceae bacterium]